MKKIFEALTFPFGKTDKKTNTIIIIVEVLLLGLILQFFTTNLKPSDILTELFNYLQTATFYDNLIATLIFVVKGMFLAMLLTMVISYSYPIAIFRPLVELVMACRYLTFSTVLFIFSQNAGSMENLKMVLMLFGVVPFFTTSFVHAIKPGEGTPYYEITKSFVNKKNKWETLWEVIIVGRVDRVLSAVDDNLGYAWAIITAVESYSMSQGGIGTMLVTNNKAYHTSATLALALIVLLIGLSFGWAFKKSREAIPYISH